MSQSFVVFSIGTDTLESVAGSMELEGDLNNADVIEAYLERLNTAINAANEITMDCFVLGSAIAETTVISSESYGGGFGSGCKSGSEGKDVEYFTSVDTFLEKVKHNAEERAERYVDFNKIFRFDTDPPSLDMIEEDGTVSRICQDYEVGITVYVYSAEEDVMYYNAWDDSGDIEEGFLDDPEDEDWAFTPEFHKDLLQFLS